MQTPPRTQTVQRAEICNLFPWLLQGSPQGLSLFPRASSWGKMAFPCSADHPNPGSFPAQTQQFTELHVSRGFTDTSDEARGASMHTACPRKGCWSHSLSPDSWKLGPRVPQRSHGKMNLSIAFPGKTCFLKIGSRLARMDYFPPLGPKKAGWQ